MAKSRNAGENNPMFGKTHSPETREKMGRAHLGKKQPPWPEEWLKNQSLAQKGIAAGANNPMWNGGKKAAGRLLDGRTWDEVPHGL